MRGSIRRLHVVALAVVLAGCWPVPGQNADRTAYNRFESRITSENVGDLVETWSWTSPRNQPVGSPAISADGLHLAAPPCHVATLLPEDGSLLWQSVAPPVDEEICLASPWQLTVEDPFMVGDSLYVSSTGTGFLPGNSGHERHTVNLLPATGQRLNIRDDATLDAYRGGDAIMTAGALTAPGTISYSVLGGPIDGEKHPIGLNANVNGTLGTDLYYTGRPASIEAYDPAGCGQATCPPAWSTATDGSSNAPVLHPDGSTIYAVTAAGTVYALNASDGTVLWTAVTGAAMPSFPASPALAEGRLFVPTAEGLVVVDANGCGAATCEPLWSAPTASAVAVQPAVGGDVVYAGSIDGSVDAFAAEGCGAATCEPLWSAETGSRITGGPVVSDGQLYVGTQDGRLVAYGLS